MSVDSPSQQSALIETLSVPFPILSDPDRSAIIEPLGIANPDDPRNLALPAMILFDADGEERWRFVSRDYADRLPEDEVLEQVKVLGLDPTHQPPPITKDAQAGPAAMPFEGLWFYLRGARFAAQAMGLRHRRLDDSIKEDSKAYVAEMDLMLEAVKDLTKRRQ